MIAVGGCYAEAQRERLFELYPFVDVAFGPGSIPHLGEWLGAGGQGVTRSRFEEWAHFAGDLPARRERPFQAWVQISMGCNSKCAYCIVPAVRGREQSRRPGDIVAEIEALAADGVREVTLLGQNVNSWGRDLAPDMQTEFGELLRACDAVDGIERIRFTSPHPKDFREPVIEAIAECAAVCEHVHLPLQSGSTRILKAMRRTYSPRALPRARRAAARGDSRPRPDDRHHRRLPRRDRGRLRGDPGSRRDGALRQRVHVRVQSTAGHGGGHAARPGARGGQARAHRAPDRRRAADRARAERGARRGVEEVLVEGPSRTDPAVLRGRTRRNTTVNFTGAAEPGELVPVRIESATSTTLRGTLSVAVAA